jgi:hypothetical protein
MKAKKSFDKKATIMYNCDMGKSLQRIHCIRMQDSIRDFKILLGIGVFIS